MEFYAEIDPRGRIVPLYDSDYESFKKVRKNTPLKFKVTQPRNYKFHKKFFALINMVFDNQEVYNNIEDLRSDLTIESGFFQEHENFKGEVIKKAKSISFSKMDEIEFNSLYNNFLDTIILVMKWDKEDIMRELESYM